MENWIESLAKAFTAKLSKRLNEEQTVPELPFGGLETGGSSIFGQTQAEKDEDIEMARARKRQQEESDKQYRISNSQQKERERKQFQEKVAKERRANEIKKATEVPNFAFTIAENKNWLHSLNKTYTNIFKNKFVKEEASLDGPNSSLHPDIVKELIRQGYHHTVHNPIKRSSTTSGRGYYVTETPADNPYSFPGARIKDPQTQKVTVHPAYEGWTKLSGPYTGD